MPVDVPQFIQENAQRGLQFYEEGLGGDGLVARTIREARQLAEGYTVESKPKRMAAWFARHESDLDAPRNSNQDHEDFPGAGAVAWLLWGGNPTESDPMRAAKWAERKAEQIEAENERNIPMNYERRTANEGVELREEDDKITAVGYAAVFNSTSQNLGGFVERVAPNAFRKTLQEADVRALFNHEPDGLLGRTSNGTLRLMEDDYGLRYEVDLPNTTLGRDVAELLRRGDLSGSSFGFRMIGDMWDSTDDGFPLRTLTEIALRDVGPVVFPAYLAAEASLRSLAEEKELPIEEVMEAAETNSLSDLLNEEEAAPEEPSETHSTGTPLSSFIR